MTTNGFWLLVLAACAVFGLLWWALRRRPGDDRLRFAEDTQPADVGDDDG